VATATMAATSQGILMVHSVPAARADGPDTVVKAQCSRSLQLDQAIA